MGEMETCLYNCGNNPEKNGKLMKRERGGKGGLTLDSEIGVGAAFSCPISPL
jgi:hypothetical protein